MEVSGVSGLITHGCISISDQKGFLTSLTSVDQWGVCHPAGAPVNQGSPVANGGHMAGPSRRKAGRGPEESSLPSSLETRCQLPSVSLSSRHPPPPIPPPPVHSSSVQLTQKDTNCPPGPCHKEFPWTTHSSSLKVIGGEMIYGASHLLLIIGSPVRSQHIILSSHWSKTSNAVKRNEKIRWPVFHHNLWFYGHKIWIQNIR